jgi:hypothetical protein
MVVDVMDVGRSQLKISVAFVDGDFHVATLYRDQVLTLSETRCSGVVNAGKCVEARFERLRIGGLNSHERGEVARLKAALDADLRADIETLQLDE